MLLNGASERSRPLGAFWGLLEPRLTAKAYRQVKAGLAQCTLCRYSHEAVFESIRYDPEACRHVKVKWRSILSTGVAATENVMASLPVCSMSCSVHGGFVK